jgi:hypothetical membrane protein
MPHPRTEAGLRARTTGAGGALALVAIQFVAAMAVVQWAYPGYSDLSNAISDLGNPLHSPWAAVFNDSIRLLGAAGLVLTYLIRPAFAWTARVSAGFAFLYLTAVGAFLVGTFPENSPYLAGHIHAIVSALTFAGATLALLLLGAGMQRDVRWRGWVGLTLGLGLLTLAATVLFALGSSSNLAGLFERLLVAPILLWLVLVGIRIARHPGLAERPRPFLGRPA